MTDHLTQVTGSVIRNNTVTEIHLADASVGTRQIVDGSVTSVKLATTLADFQANDYNTYITAQSNEYNTYLSALANDFSTYTILNDALNALISGSTEFTSFKIFQSGVIIQGDLTVEGDSFTANVGTLQVEDKNITVNFKGTNATAEGSGLLVEGDSAYFLANLEYASASVSLFRIGEGVLTSADDISRTQDYQANDYITYNQAQANINALSSNTLPLIGGTLTGDLVLVGDPDSALKAATRQYVDAATAAFANAIPVSNTNTSTSTSNVFFLGINNTTSEAHIFVWTDGVYQSEDFWVYNSGNNTIQLDEASMPAGIEVATRAFTEVA